MKNLIVNNCIKKKYLKFNFTIPVTLQNKSRLESELSFTADKNQD